MKEQTTRILEQALAILVDFENDKVSLGFLVKSLEGSISALEEEPSSSFVEEWYKYWGALEEIHALAETGELFVPDPISYVQRLKLMVEKNIEEA